MYLRQFVVSIAVFVTTLSAADKPAILQPGTLAPTFSLPALAGDRVSLRLYCGDTLLKPHVNNIRQIVVLSFWATYCKPCRKEIPELMKFAAAHVADSVKILLVSIDKEGAPIVDPYVKENKFTLPVLLDPYRKTAERYGVSSLPALFVLDGKGTIRYSSVGFKENDPLDAKLESIVADIRANRPVAAALNVAQGEAVAVEAALPVAPATAAPAAPVAPAPLTAKDRWNAIVAVECGMSLEKLADSLKVEPQAIKGWYADLKSAATALWEGKK